jgi:hypothetical protein
MLPLAAMSGVVASRSFTGLLQAIKHNRQVHACNGLNWRDRHLMAERGHAGGS